MTDLPVPPTSHHRRARSATTIGVDPGAAAMLSYLLGAVSGVVLFLIERRNTEVRFHAAQSMLLTGAVLAVWLFLSVLPTIPVFSLLAQAAGVLVWMATLAGWIFLMVVSAQLEHVRVPVIGAWAEWMAGID